MLGYSVVLLQFFPDSQNTKEYRSKKDFIFKKRRKAERRRKKKKKGVIYPDLLGHLKFRIYSHDNVYFIKALS